MFLRSGFNQRQLNGIVAAKSASSDDISLWVLAQYHCEHTIKLNAEMITPPVIHGPGPVGLPLDGGGGGGGPPLQAGATVAIDKAAATHKDVIFMPRLSFPLKPNDPIGGWWFVNRRQAGSVLAGAPRRFYEPGLQASAARHKLAANRLPSVFEPKRRRHQLRVICANVERRQCRSRCPKLETSWQNSCRYASASVSGELDGSSG